MEMNEIQVAFSVGNLVPGRQCCARWRIHEYIYENRPIATAQIAAGNLDGQVSMVMRRVSLSVFLKPQRQLLYSCQAFFGSPYAASPKSYLKQTSLFDPSFHIFYNSFTQLTMIPSSSQNSPLLHSIHLPTPSSRHRGRLEPFPTHRRPTLSTWPPSSPSSKQTVLRRSTIDLKKSSTVSDARIEEIAKHSILHTPTPFQRPIYPCGCPVCCIKTRINCGT